MEAGRSVRGGRGPRVLMCWEGLGSRRPFRAKGRRSGGVVVLVVVVAVVAAAAVVVAACWDGSVDGLVWPCFLSEARYARAAGEEAGTRLLEV